MKKKDIKLVFKGADKQSFQELLDDLRPKGVWKEYKLRNDIVVKYAFKCSNCKEDSGLLYHADFCPNCGADMRGAI